MPRFRRSPGENPYLDSVFEGIDLLVADVQQHNIGVREREESNIELERKQKERSTTRRLGILSEIGTPESTKTALEIIKDPEAEIPETALERPPEPKTTRTISEYALHKEFGFPKYKGIEVPHAVANFMEKESRQRREDYFDRTQKATEKKEKDIKSKAKTEKDDLSAKLKVLDQQIDDTRNNMKTYVDEYGKMKMDHPGVINARIKIRKLEEQRDKLREEVLGVEEKEMIETEQQQKESAEAFFKQLQQGGIPIEAARGMVKEKFGI